jgi:SAM-dependent methyltransferase
MLMLDVGCGSAKHKGCIGVDLRKLECVDVVADGSRLPFKDYCFNQIFLRHAVEHVPDIVAFMEEIWRVGNDGATIHIWTPHFTSFHSYTDPTHLHHLTIESFDYFDDTTELSRQFKFCSKSGFKVKYRKIIFTKRIFWNYLIEKLANKRPLIYERLFGWIFPADDLYFELKALKPASNGANETGTANYASDR